LGGGQADPGSAASDEKGFGIHAFSIGSISRQRRVADSANWRLR
jgi:hypothetical protein